VAGGETAIVGVMMESFLVDGRQDLANRATLRYGQSITDACLSWDTTLTLLADLAAAVNERRRVLR
jgi:3-deoxy-7-phosphoheptulonate synthase